MEPGQSQLRVLAMADIHRGNPAVVLTSFACSSYLPFKSMGLGFADIWTTVQSLLVVGPSLQVHCAPRPL